MSTLRLRNVLLDRDGTLIEERHYLSDPEGVSLIPGAVQGLKELKRAGCRLFLVTNQSGIGRGYFDLNAYAAVQGRIDELLSRASITLTGQAFCPHAPQERCSCRKPALGMWERLRDLHDLRPEESVMVGDKAEDVLFGRRAGLAASILVLTGHGKDAAKRLELPQTTTAMTLPESDRLDLPHAVVADLGAAARWIIERMGAG
jgi:D-glycero-D-manno-heptose 1,7-bisphosphate phosphatase